MVLTLPVQADNLKIFNCVYFFLWLVSPQKISQIFCPTYKKDADDLADFTSMPNLDNVKIPSEQLDKLPVSWLCVCCINLTTNVHCYSSASATS